MSTVRNAGDRMLFREDFWNSTMVGRNDGVEVGAPVISDGLSGGQVAWYGKAHTYAFDRDISVVAECISVVSGSNQALLSIGTLAARRLEFGIDALGQPYAWGTAQVNLGLPVDDGPHVFGFSVDTYGNVTCVVDGVLWGTGTVTFGPLTTRMVAAGSCLGGLAWGATVRPIRIYGYAADYATLVSLCGLPASLVWTPDLMLVGRDGLYEDLDAAGAVTLAAQPVLLDPLCDDVTKWTVGNSAALSNIAAAPRSGNCMRVQRNGSNNPYAYQNILTIANRYLVGDLWARGDGVVPPMLYTGNFPKNGTPSTAWQDMSVDWTPTNTVFGVLCSGINNAHYSDFDGPMTLRNLSVNAIACKGNLGNLAQATPANMTWSSDPQAPTSVPRVGRTVLYSDGAADHNVSTLAAAGWPLHQAAGFTYCEVLQIAAAAAGNNTLVDNCNRSALSHGINANYDVTNKKLVVSVANGSGMFMVSEGMTVAPGKNITVDATWTEADGLEVSVNGAPPMVQPTPPADKAIFMDGTNDNISMGDVLGFEWNQPFSISALVRTSTVSGTIYAKATSGASIKGVVLSLSASGRISFALHGSSTRQVILNSAPIVTDGNIHHIVATYDGSGNPAGMSIYVDNVEGYSQSLINTLAGLTILNTTNLRLGVRESAIEFLTGQEGDVTVFNKKLSVAEVDEIYNSGRPVDMLATSLAQNLLAWWKMGEGDTFPTITDVRHGAAPSALYPTILDVSGSGFHGTMTNMATNDVVPDSPGGDFSKMSLDFDGVNDFVNMGNVLDFGRTDAFSLDIWVRATAGTYIVSKFQASPVKGWGLRFGATANIEMLLYNNSSNEASVQTIATGFTDNNWRHIVVTVAGTGVTSGTKIYVNSVELPLTDIEDTLGALDFTNTGTLNFGCRNTVTGMLTGKINSAAIHNAVLTPAQVIESYNGGVPTDNRLLSSAPNLVGYWRMGDDVRFDGTMVSMTAANIVDMGPSAAAASATLQDGRTSGNADFFQGYRADKLVLVGKATAGELANWRRYTAAKYGIDTRAKACQFNGVNQYVTMGNVLAYDYTNDFSIGGWIKTASTSKFFVCKQTVGANEYRGYYLGVSATGKLDWTLRSNNATGNLLRVESVDSINTGNWVHVCATYRGTAGTGAAATSLYINGLPAASSIVLNNLTATIVSAAPLNFGARNSVEVFYSGSLDEINVWGKTLTPAQVAEIHNGGNPVNLRALSIPPKDLFGWWRMGDSDIYPTLLDSAGYGNYNGTMTNMAASDIIDRT